MVSLVAVTIMVVQLLAGMTFYLLLLLDIVRFQWIVRAYNKVRNFVVKVVLKLVDLPILAQLACIAGAALLHQVAVYKLPKPLLLWTMQNRTEEWFLKTGMSEKMEETKVFVNRRPWLQLLLLPVAVYYLIVSGLLGLFIQLITDQHTSATVLLVVCLPVILSLSMWYAESKLIPEKYRQNLLFTSSANQKETPSAGVKHKIILISTRTIMYIISLVMIVAIKHPSITRHVLGRKIDRSIYVVGVCTAVFAATAIVAIILDGQTVEGKNNTWTESMVNTFYHRVMVLMCIAIAVVLVVFPIFNNPFFSTRMMRTSIV